MSESEQRQTIQVYVFDRETNEAWSSEIVTVNAPKEGAQFVGVTGFRTAISLSDHRLVLPSEMTEKDWAFISKKQDADNAWKYSWEDQGRRNDYRKKTLTQEEKAKLPPQMKPSEFVGMETQQAKALLLKQHPYSIVEVTKPGVGVCQMNYVQIIEKNGKVQTVNIN